MPTCKISCIRGSGVWKVARQVAVKIGVLKGGIGRQ